MSSQNEATAPSSEFGDLCRSHDCGLAQSAFFHLLGAGMIAGGIFFWVNMSVRSFNDAIFPLLFILGGLLTILAGWRNSKIRLDLYENGMTFTGSGSQWKCRYDQISELYIHSQSANGGKMPVGIQVVLKNGQSFTAKAITKVREAAGFIQAKR